MARVGNNSNSCLFSSAMATPTSSRRYSRFQPAAPVAPSTAEDEANVPTVSASVGHDHWANDVLKAVDKAGSGSTGSGSNSPESYCDSASDGGRPSAVLLDPAEVVKSKILEKKRKFHTGRSLELKNLPDGCVEQDIREAFPDLGIVSVTIERNDGRYKASAKLTLDYPELLDDWPESRQNVFVRNKEVSVCVGNSDGWLCVAKLPLSYTEEEFFNLASAYGKVREAFLMVSERTGDSKGYGLIKYVSSEAAAQARHLLDGRSVTGGHPDNPHDVYKLDCDWLNSSHISFGSLHSKALYVDHLPPNFRDMTEFRRFFSVVKSPPYCQIAMPKGVIQDWGLVEFFNPLDSEATQRATNLNLFHGRRIRVHFCIPGVNAINIYMQAVNAPPDTKKKALLQDTPTASVYSQLQKLAAQNPAFAQNLQNIIQEQIQTLSSGTPMIPSSSATSTSTASSSIATRPVPSASSTANNSNLLYGVPTATASAQPVPAAAAAATATATSTNTSASISSNAQAALMILLTAQMQSQSGEPSVLQNPQVVSILQTLVNNAATGSNDKPTTVDINELLKDPSLASVFRPNGLNETAAAAVAAASTRPALLDTPKTRPILLGNPPTASASLSQQQLTAAAVANAAVASNDDLMATNLDNLLNTQNLNQLLGSLNTPVATATSTAADIPAAAQQAQQQATAVQPPPQPPVVSHHSLLPTPTVTSTGYYQRPVLLETGQSLMGFNPYQTTSSPFILQQQQQQQPPQHLYVAPPQHQHQHHQQLLGFQGYPTAAAAAAYYGQNMAVMASSAPHQAVAFQAAPGSAPTPQMYASFATPPPPPMVGSKRRLAIPPSPEQSPEGNYVGQHSQGIGGHYASSYFTKKAKKY